MYRMVHVENVCHESYMTKGKGISVIEHTGFLFQASKKRKETGKRQYHGITCKGRKKARELLRSISIVVLEQLRGTNQSNRRDSF